MSLRGFWDERYAKRVREGKITDKERDESREFFRTYLKTPRVNPRNSITDLIPSMYDTQENRDRYSRAVAEKKALDAERVGV